MTAMRREVMTEAPYSLPDEMFWTDDDFYHEEYCARPREVACICGTTETGSEEQLRRNGWVLGRSEICPKCFEYLQVITANAEVARCQSKAA